MDENTVMLIRLETMPPHYDHRYKVSLELKITDDISVTMKAIYANNAYSIIEAINEHINILENAK